ncbi:cell wall-binding repeat-containing protein [Clostridium coskatii]|uniref:N-acetylmuramoyl-L-alanine amidase LytC n=2 Tax=Clostridium coskatii TaxID=1705578 RepID=A0A168NFC0_9CLOT|nr:cell wall-binding repeat-containing protein [Clostridium coskatii]OAA86354.1 N-acetylmuramoyl-L-alanine amidase LytC precursor [Clostridium coskatii]OBR95079.1 N-acetylmuramoyl-L-alanine amidase LytC precursor [Clostridium coskatii]
MKSKKLMAIVLSAAVCASLFGYQNKSFSVKADSQTVQTSQTTQTKGNITRIGGVDRYDTAVKIAQYGWKTADTVFIAGAENDRDFADAIAGTPLAYDMDAPILLTRAAALPDNVSSEITALFAKDIVILGGTAVVSQDIEDGLKAKGYNVSRIAGQTRYDTAIQIAKKLWEREPNGKTSVAITTGNQFQYAMYGAVGSAMYHSAILFSDGTTLNKDVENLLAGDESLSGIDVIGGDKVLSVKGTLYNNRPDLFHIENYNSVDELCDGTGGLGSLNCLNGVAVASSTIFPDALSGSVLAAKSGCKLLLSDGKKINYNIDTGENNLSTGLVFGGTKVISDDVISQMQGMLNKDYATPNVDGLKDSDLVPFADPAFKKDAEKALNKTDITVADAKSATSLELFQNASDGGEQINSLDDIKFFPNITVLEIHYGTLPDSLIALNSMPKLKYLAVCDNCKYNTSSINALSNNISFWVDDKEVSH